MIGIPGYSKKLLSVLAKEKINVIMMTQASSEHSICIGIESSMAPLAKKMIEDDFDYEIETQRINPISVEDKLSIIALVGENMKSHQGISGKMFSALGRNNVNVKAIAQGASERNITAVIDSSNTKQALNILHEAFFEKHIKFLNNYLAVFFVLTIQVFLGIFTLISGLNLYLASLHQITSVILVFTILNLNHKLS